MKIAVLMTVHNRRDKTLECLKRLYSQILPIGVSMDVFLTDDGCTDGTKEAVTERFPNVRIITGDGSLFWNHGMNKAWVTASKTYDYDFYLWLNDDTYIIPETIGIMFDSSAKINHNGIIVGTTSNSCGTAATYGGMIDGKLISPNGNLQPCLTFNGNVVLVSKHAFEQIGFLDSYYIHAIGDIDYGLMAAKKGIKCMVAHCYIGSCDDHTRLPDWVCPDVPFLKRWKNFHSPLGYGEPKAFFHFNKKHFGLATAFNVYVRNHFRLFFPALWNRIIVR